MKRVRPWLVAIALVVVAGIGALAWRAWAARQAWEDLRPPLPAPAGPRAPGLDARVQACAARLSAYPPDVDALEEFARLCHANGQLEEASAAYRALLRLDPQSGRWPYALAVIEAGYGRLDVAVVLLRQAVRLAPEHVPAWLRLGGALLKADDVAGANAAYEEALRRAPEDPFALLGLGRCALREERWTAARGLLQRAVAADPRMAPALYLLATVHERLGNQGAAASAAGRADAAAMEVEPPDPWLDDLYQWCHDTYRLRVVASSALASARLERALAACERARLLAPEDARVHWQFARIHRSMGRLDEAREALERAVELDPADDRAQLDLIQVLHQTGDTAAVLMRQAEYQRRFGAHPP